MGTDTALVRSRGQVLLASGPGVHTSAGSIALPPDTAVWIAAD
jgi:alpha-glucosidase